MENTLTLWLSIITSFIGLISLLVAIVALRIAYKSFNFKKGVGLKGYYTLGEDWKSDCIYVDNIILENYKDRAITIYGVYLRWKKSEYLELIKYKTPIILNAFESKTINFDNRVEMYLLNNKRIDISNELESKNIKKELVVATSEGKCIVDKFETWMPNENKIIKSHIELYNGGYYPKAKFLIEYTTANGKIGIEAVYEHEHKIYRQFSNISNKIQLEEKIKEVNAEKDNTGWKWVKWKIIEFEKEKEDKYGKKNKL